MLTLTRTQSIGEAIADSIITHKRNVALIEADRHRENGRWTYRELEVEAKRLGALLQRHGFGPGNRCAILMQNQAKWIFSALGALWAGGVLVPVDYKLEPEDQLGILEHAEPSVLITEYASWEKLQRRPQAGLERTLVLVTEAPEGAELGRAKRWETAIDTPLRPVTRSRSDLACIVYSSGTSGRPKGCMLTHDNYLSQAQILGRLYPIEEEDRYFSILPTNHAIDFMLGFVVPLLFGAAVVHQRTLRAQFIRQTMKEYGITHIGLVPAILRNLQKRIREQLDDLPFWQRTAVDNLARLNDFLTAREPNHGLSRRLLAPVHAELGGKLRLVVAGGTFVERELAEFFYEYGIPVAIGYGLTEACTVISVNDLKPFRADTVGAPVPGIEVEIRDANAEGVGEVWVRGPTVMLGYYKDPELTAETIVDGWLRTGDMGWMDVTGHLKLVGRKKNMIVTEGGKNVYPEDVETKFVDMRDCEEYCVFSANFVWPTGKMSGDELVLVVRPAPEADVDALVERMRQRNRALPDYKRVSSYVLHRDDFPATASRKVKRDALAQELRKIPRQQALQPLED